MQNKRLLIILLSAASLLLIPLIAMQFTSEVNWKLPDFIAAGVLLLGTGLLCELVMRKVKTRKLRIILCVALLVLLLLVWAELAVGIFGSLLIPPYLFCGTCSPAVLFSKPLVFNGSLN